MSIDADDWLDRFAPSVAPVDTGGGDDSPATDENPADKTRALLQRRGAPPDPNTRVDGSSPDGAAAEDSSSDTDWLDRFAPAVRAEPVAEPPLIGTLPDGEELSEDELLNRALGLDQGAISSRRQRGRRRNEPSTVAPDPNDLIEEPVAPVQPGDDDVDAAAPTQEFFEAEGDDALARADEAEQPSDAVPTISVQDSQLFDAADRQSPFEPDGSINWETPHLFDLGEFGTGDASPNQIFSNDPVPEPPAEWVVADEDPPAVSETDHPIAAAPPPWPSPPALGPDGIPLLEPLTTSLPRPPVEWGWEEAWPDGSPKHWDDSLPTPEAPAPGDDPVLDMAAANETVDVEQPTGETEPSVSTAPPELPAAPADPSSAFIDPAWGEPADGSATPVADRPPPPIAPNVPGYYGNDIPGMAPVGESDSPQLPWDSVIGAGPIAPVNAPQPATVQGSPVGTDAPAGGSTSLDATVDEPRWSQAMEQWERGGDLAGAVPTDAKPPRGAEAMTLPSTADASMLPGLEPHPHGAVQNRPEGLRANPATRVLIDWLPVVIGAFLVAVLVRFFVFQAYYIPSTSMTPTLEVSDRVLVNKLSYSFGDVDRGDVVVFKRPAANGGTEDLIKRVIGLPGETVVFRNGDVFVDGQLVEETYLLDAQSSTTRGPIPNCVGEAPDECLVPAGHVLVLGDNRVGSSDGRVFGPISTDEIVGRAFVRVWPLNDLGLL